MTRRARLLLQCNDGKGCNSIIFGQHNGCTLLGCLQRESERRGWKEGDIALVGISSREFERQRCRATCAAGDAVCASDAVLPRLTGR